MVYTMKEYKHLVNCLAIRFAAIQIQLSLNNKKRADELTDEAYLWLKNTYTVVRKG